MKKWFKALYKIYLIAFFLILTCMTLGMIGELGLFNKDIWVESFRFFKENVQRYPEYDALLFADIAVWNVNSILSLFFTRFKFILLIGLTIVHAVVIWGERSTEQREFLVTLPVKKRDRELVRILMDIVLVFSTIIICAVISYFCLNNIYARENMHIPWLAGSVYGVAITTICYMTVLIGILHLIEALVVRGDMKIIVVIACLVMVHLCVKNLFNLAEYDDRSILHDIYGYVNLCTVGGCYYNPDNRETIYYDGIWDHKPMDVAVQYNGETGFTLGNCEIWRLVDFGNINSYIWYALSYLLIGAALILLSIYLVKRQELSKSGFYFHGGITLIGLLIGITFFCYGILFSPSVWNSVLIVISSVIIFAGFVYIVDRKCRT